MAQEVNVRGANVKIQGLGSQIGLLIITLGIYGIFWYYRINKEMKEIGTATGDASLANSSPGSSVLAVTLGAMIVIPALISVINTGKRIEQTQRALGMNPPSFNFVVHILLMFVTGLYPLYDQAELNKTWKLAAQTGAAQAAAA